MMPATLVAPAPCARSSLPVCRADLPVTLGLRHVGPRRIMLRLEAVGAPDLPTVVVLGGISAGRHVLANDTDPSPGWWDEQVGAGRPVDPAVHRVVSIDWVGADGDLDVPIDTRDQADAVITALEHLGVQSAYAVIGSSYGGLVALQLAARHRRRVGHLIVFSASARPNPYAAAFRALERRVVALGASAGRSEDALALARQLAMLSYRTPAEFAQRFTGGTTITDGVVRTAAEDYLEACGARYTQRWTATAFRRLSESIDLHAVDPAAITVPATLAAVEGDWLAPPSDSAELAAGSAASATVHRIESAYGHDAFLKERERVAEIIRLGLTAAAERAEVAA